MEIKKQKKNPAKIISITTLAIVVITLAGYGTYAFMAKTWPFQDLTPTNSTVAKDSNSNSPDKAESTGPSSSTSSDDQDKTPIKYSPPSSDTGSPDDSTSSNGITATVNYANVVNGALEIRTTITELLKSGTCKLTLENTSTGDKSTYTTSIIANPSSSACDGFNIPTKNLAKGDYNISIQLTSDDKTGVATGKVSI